MKKLLIIFFLLISSQPLFAKKTVQEEANNFPYCKNKSFFFLNNLNEFHYPKKILIKTNELKSWYINLIKSFYSTTRSNWKLDPDYKKYKRAKIILEFNNKINCEFNGKIKIHGGRKDHVDLETLTSSLRVKLYDGHLNHSRHFALLRPFTRNGDDEIFITSLLSKIDLISPSTFYTEVQLNNNKSQKMIFQDMDYLEILRDNKRPEGVVIAENKTNNDNTFTLTRTINVDDQPLQTGWNMNKNYYFNALDKTNYILLNEKFNNQKDILSNTENHFFLEKKKFINFYLLMYATNGIHGSQFGDRRYYYNIILDKIEPIYYDWKPQFVSKINNDELVNPINYKFTDIEIDSLIRKIENIDFIIMGDELRKKGLEIEKNNLLSLKIKLIKNLSFIKSNIKYSNENKKFIQYKYLDNLIYPIKENFYELCDKKNKCKKIQINQEIEKGFMKNHEFVINKKKVKYIRKKTNFFQDNKPPEKHTVNRMKKVSLSNNSDLFYNEYVEIFKDNNNLKIDFNNEEGRVYVVGGEIANYEIFINKDDINHKKKISSQKLSIEDNFVPYCLSFYDVRLKKIKLFVKNLDCNKDIRFIKSSGVIDKVEINNSGGDALSAELSNLTFNEINIIKAKDDCLDFESGKYYFKKVNLSKCSDKAIQVKRKANIKIDELKVIDSNYGLSVHDSSFLIGNNFKIDTEKECLSIYRENDSFYGSKVDITNQLICSNNSIFKHKGSKLIVKNVIQN